MGGELRLQVSEEGADAGRLALLTGHLQADLRLNVADVVAPRAGNTPPDAQGSAWLLPVPCWSLLASPPMLG
jgi:hypothetical protein